MAAKADRLSKQAIDDLQAELSEWTAPTAFRKRVDEIVRPLHRDIFFGQAGLAFLRDAWIAGRVASVLLPEKVRLIREERPDFEFCNEGAIQQFEATEADRTGRRRGDEPATEGWRPDPVEQWRERFEAIPDALGRVVTKKLAKPYRPDVSLVIYLNLGCYGAYVSEGLPIIRDATARANEKFEQVFVMWEGTLYRVWHGGAQTSERWSYADPDDF